MPQNVYNIENLSFEFKYVYRYSSGEVIVLVMKNVRV